MSSLTLPEVQDLFRRAQLSLLRGYTIARGDLYAEKLGGTDGSPAGLVALCKAALEANAPEAPAPVDVPPEVPTLAPADEEAIPDTVVASEPVAPELASEAEAPAPVGDPEPDLSELVDEEPAEGGDETTPADGESGEAPKASRRRKRR